MIFSPPFRRFCVSDIARRSDQSIIIIEMKKKKKKSKQKNKKKS